MCEEELIFSDADESADEDEAEEDSAVAEIDADEEKALEETAQTSTSRATTAKKILKIAKKGAPIAISALVVAAAAVTLYKASQKRQKSKLVEQMVKFFR